MSNVNREVENTKLEHRVLQNLHWRKAEMTLCCWSCCTFHSSISRRSSVSFQVFSDDLVYNEIMSQSQAIYQSAKTGQMYGWYPILNELILIFMMTLSALSDISVVD